MVTYKEFNTELKIWKTQIASIWEKFCNFPPLSTLEVNIDPVHLDPSKQWTHLSSRDCK